MRTIIIPTVNEAANVGRLIPLIFEYVGEDSTSVIIVDDSSTDGTIDVVRELSDQYDVHLLERSHRLGISSAVQQGAMKANEGHVAVMDADFSHHPKYLPLLFNKLDEGYDVVIGSRYIPGGGVSGWPVHRVVISRGATAIAKALFRIPVKDPMSGFIAVRSSDILADSIKNPGSKFVLEVLIGNNSLRYAEIPINFENRRRGESKMSIQLMLFYLALVGRAFLRQNGRIRKILDRR
ncbi:MAG: polyprenol monophosphomannose synthase [Candidatus Thorarchaeota archaeon]|nr:polyprenol monophosphomannose synthase [Candidatus Thorarchaeota archaeon]